MHAPMSSSGPDSFVNVNDRTFCIEIFARRASLCGYLRTVLPSSFAIGRGCSQASAAPIVPIDILSPGGLALCASWLREPDCAWVHIRCPAAIFPKRTLNSQLPSQEVERCIHTFYQLLKHCKDTDTRWTVEAPSRSSFWTTSLGRDLEACAVDIDLSRFALAARGHIRFASSCPEVLAGVGQPLHPPTHVKQGSEV